MSLACIDPNHRFCHRYMELGASKKFDRVFHFFCVETFTNQHKRTDDFTDSVLFLVTVDNSGMLHALLMELQIVVVMGEDDPIIRKSEIDMLFVKRAQKAAIRGGSNVNTATLQSIRNCRVYVLIQMELNLPWHFQ